MKTAYSLCVSKIDFILPFIVEMTYT